MIQLQQLWHYIIDYEIATENELIHETNQNGLNLTTLQQLLYNKTGYTTFAQHIEAHTPQTKAPSKNEYIL
jgi:predicted Ser/Thr protein kinase